MKMIFSAYLLSPIHVPSFFYAYLLLKKPRQAPCRQYRGEKIAVIIPCHNEEDVIGGTLDAVFQMEGNYQVIVVDDGSSDRTSEIAREKGAFVVRREKGGRGKGDAINYGLQFIPADVEYVVILDADSHPPKDLIPRLFCYLSDRVAAVCGLISVRNKYKNWLTRIINVEFQIANLLQVRKSQDRYFTPLLPGTGMLIRRSFCSFPNSLTEDSVLSMEIVKKGYEIVVVPGVFVNEVEVETLKAYFRQRRRWSRGNWDLLKHFTRKKPLNYLLILVEKIQPILAILSWALFIWGVAHNVGIGLDILLALWILTTAIYLSLLIKADDASQTKIPVKDKISYLILSPPLYFATWLLGLLPTSWQKTKTKH